MGKYVALNRGFMLVGIFGFLISLIFIMQYNKDWGFTFSIFFAFVFIASIISMSNATMGDKEAEKELAIHENPPKAMSMQNKPDIVATKTPASKKTKKKSK
jgi:hypothetical protein